MSNFKKRTTHKNWPRASGTGLRLPDKSLTCSCPAHEPNSTCASRVPGKISAKRQVTARQAFGIPPVVEMPDPQPRKARNPVSYQRLLLLHILAPALFLGASPSPFMLIHGNRRLLSSFSSQIQGNCVPRGKGGESNWERCVPS